MPGNLPSSLLVPGWPQPNYVDPVRRTWMPPYSITITVISTITVIVRFALRMRHEGGGLGYDDALLLPAWLLSMCFTAIACYGSESGLTDRHLWDVPPDRLQDDVLMTWISTVVFLVGTTSLKVSILMFYRRIQAGTYSRRWMAAIWAGIAFTVAYGLTFLFAAIFNCQPTQAYWKAFNPVWTQKHSFHCTDTKDINIIAGVISVFGDAYALVLPCLMLQSLEMPRRQKLGMNAVFALSIVVVAAGCGRTYSFHRLSESPDQTWVGFWTFFWTIMEWNMGIICACAPSLRVFVKRFLGSSIASHSYSYSHSRSESAQPKRRPRTDSESELTSLSPDICRHRIFRDTTITIDSTEKAYLSKVAKAKMRESKAASISLSYYGVSTEPSGIKTPKDYEEFQLDVIEKGRRSWTLGPTRSRSSPADSRSLPTDSRTLPTDKELPTLPSFPPPPSPVYHGFQ